MAASYRLLCPHYIGGVWYAQNTVVAEGAGLPFGWVPTLAVDPLNSEAVDAYYAAGPRNIAYEANPDFGGAYWPPVTGRIQDVMPAAATHWVKLTETLWRLTGLGANKPYVGSP